MRYAPFLVLLLLSCPVFAQRAKAPPPPGGIVQEPDGKLEISPAICKALAAEGPPADYQPGVDAGGHPVASAEYQPGVDAEGHPVAPADLPGSNTLNTDAIIIEIDANVAGRIKLPRSVTGTAILGYVVVHGNQAYFNGQPLTGDQDAAIRAACHQAGL